MKRNPPVCCAVQEGRMCPEEVGEPTVSVIVPVLNAQATIRDLLDSLMDVDYDKRKLEVIVVDGGSTDGTRDIVQAYPVELILEARRGLNVARNAGIKNSRGEILAFTDSDCVVPRDWVRRIVEGFKDARVGCVGGTVSRYNNDLISTYADESIIPVLRRFRKREILDSVEPPSRYPAGCNMAVRRSVSEKVSGFDEGILYGFDEDELVERICKSGYKMMLDPEVTVKHKHRRTLKALLKQTIRYGRGGCLLLKKKPEGRFSKWILVSLILFASWLIASSLMLILAITVNMVFLIPLLSITLVPFVLLASFYLCRGSRRERYVRFVTYPFIDLLRLLAFYVGGTYELLQVTE